MKNRKVYLGPPNNHIKDHLEKMSLEYLKDNKGHSFYYLLPNRELLSHYRNNVIVQLGATFELNYFTFDDIVARITENQLLKIADDTSKSIVMRKVLKSLREESKLSYYKDFTRHNGFVESCIYIIGRIKRSLITPEDYLQTCASSPYYREIGLIYEAYEVQLKKIGFQDKDNQYSESIHLLKKEKSFLQALDFIIIDEFYDFRPIELEIIKLLKDLDIDIYINIPYESKTKNIRLEETIADLKDLGFEIEHIVKEEYNDFEKLGNILFDSGHSKVKANIELIKASSLELEIKKILKVIKNNYSYKSIDLKDNCICIFNSEYSNMIFKTAKDEKVPLSMDRAISLKNLPLTKEIISLLEFNLFLQDKETLLNRVKSVYLPVCHDGRRDSLEYILRKSNFKDMRQLYNSIDQGKSTDIPEKYKEDIKDLIRQLEQESLAFHDKVTLGDYNSKLLTLLEDYSLEKNILERYKSNGNFQLMQRDLACLKSIKEILYNVESSSLINEEIDLEEYLMILLDYFEDEEIIETKGNPHGVKVITIDNARGINYGRVFIPGLTQGTYPNLMTSNFFFSDDNYSELRGIGIDVKGYRNRVDNETLKILALISSCQEKLYLSCNLNSQGDENPLYSIFLDEILSKLEGEKEEDKVNLTEIGLDFLYKNEIKNITSHREFSLKVFNDYYKNGLVTDQIQYHNNLYREKLEQINLQLESIIKRNAREFNNYSGLLEGNLAKEYIANEFKNKSFSVSFLENYSICPYAFLLNNIFKVEELERQTQDYNPMDNGTIYHEVLRVYYEKYKDDFNNIGEFNTSNTYDFLKDSLLSQASKLGYSTSLSNEQLLIEDMYEKLKSFIEFDIDRLKKNEDIKPWSFEQWFNMDFKVDDNIIEVRGIIDRIDRTDDGKYLIMDYKSSSYGKKTIKDIENKISLQLPIYIKSQKDKNIIGGFYGIIKTPDFYTCMGLLGESKLVNGRQTGAIDLERWNKILADTELTIEDIVIAISNGNFSVKPRECSPYCIYKDICRYDKVQEVEE